MEENSTVCCMCGDVGFPDRLFQCMRCLSRFQHSYCSNYYSESLDTTRVCDWCLSEERSSARHGPHPKKLAGKDVEPSNRSEYAGGHKIKQSGDRDEGGSRAKGASGSTSSSKSSGRRYKLLKDVLC